MPAPNFQCAAQNQTKPPANIGLCYMSQATCRKFKTCGLQAEAILEIC
jgi:hypothetical protein